MIFYYFYCIILKERSDFVIESSIIGFVIGELLSIETLGKSREELLKKPVVNIQGDAHIYNELLLEETIKSIIEKNDIDFYDIANKYYNIINSGLIEEKYIDASTKISINNYKKDNTLRGVDDNINNALIRILPLSIYLHYNKIRQEEIINYVKNMSMITNSSNKSYIGSYILLNYLMNLLNGKDKLASLSMIKYLDYSMFDEKELKKFDRILSNNINDLTIKEIKSTNDIIDTLETSIWVILKADNFKDSLVASSNLGNDSRVISSLVGFMAGILYQDDIPVTFINKISNIEELKQISKDFENIFN